MNLESITIQNFRNIGEERKFMLDNHFTTFIGVNGKGKSTILHAIRVACGSYFLAIPNVKSRHIQKDEIRLVESGKLLLPKYPVKVEVRGIVNGSDKLITWRRQWLEGSSSSTTRSADVGNIRDIAYRKYQKVVKEGDDTIDLPLIAFFGISRAVGGGRISKKSRSHQIGRQPFLQGYQDWEEMKAVKFQYKQWLARYDALLKQEKEYHGTKEAFFNAIKKANPYLSEAEFIDGELWVKVEIDNQESDLLPLSLHSDGVHYFTEMVAEISYRCIVLNGNYNDAAIDKTKGVVMIDEIDLHLHPKWQRHVVSDLKIAFPKIQFVVTTHSPFIVQSLEESELISLDDHDQQGVSPNELPINKVITDIMEVESIKSDDFEKRFFEAKSRLTDIIDSKPEQGLTMDDYKTVSRLLGNLIAEETDDAVYKAFLEKQTEKDDEAN